MRRHFQPFNASLWEWTSLCYQSVRYESADFEKSGLGVVIGIIERNDLLSLYPPYLGSSILPWYKKGEAWELGLWISVCGKFTFPTFAIGKEGGILKESSDYRRVRVFVGSRECAK